MRRSLEPGPFTATIVVHVRRKYRLPSHAQRLRDRGLLTLTEIADRLQVHPHTIKGWRQAIRCIKRYLAREIYHLLPPLTPQAGTRPRAG